MELWKRVPDNLRRFTKLNVIAWVKKLASSNFIYKRHNARTSVRYARVPVTRSLHIHDKTVFDYFDRLLISERFYIISMNEIKLERPKFSA